ncbi:MAG: DGQHR domain-containing protein [Chthonomonadales bacterium]|nr:DGQHR domain-containing protein [Chthonomonadales bacterium]
MGSTSARLRRSKSTGVWLEDRVWCLLWEMGFARMSGHGGARLESNGGNASYYDQLDVVAIDEDAALVIECKASDGAGAHADIQETLVQVDLHRKQVRECLRAEDGRNAARKVGAILVLWQIRVSDADRQRAKELRIVLLDAAGLEYYERLQAHTREAARYQLLGEVFEGQSIDGLKLCLPAVEVRFGKQRAYVFAARPEHLLKIAYVAHKSRGESAGVAAYQRMLNKHRIQKIVEFIKDNGVFPTNLVLSFTQSLGPWPRFDATAQAAGGPEGIRLGWLELPPVYHSAWVVDGQHRLLAYAGQERASTSFLCVTAFVGLDPAEQAKMFVDINSKQKRVSPNLLVELHSSLHWGSPDPRLSAHSIASRAIQDLDSRQTSVLYRRIVHADERSTNIRCITLTSVVSELLRRFYVVKVQNHLVTEEGPFWDTEPQKSLSRTRDVLDAWFGAVASAAGDIWKLGKDRGGYLAMNDGVVVMCRVLFSVLQHVRPSGRRWHEVSTSQLVEAVRPFGEAAGRYFGAMPRQALDAVRARRGVEGQTRTYYEVLRELNRLFPDFCPDGLEDWVSQQASEMAGEAYKMIRSIETGLQEFVVRRLQEMFGTSRSEWWLRVPQEVRTEVAVRRERADREYGDDEEKYLNLIDYRKIALAHWQGGFDQHLAYAATGDKQKRTEWLQKVNAIRNKVAHGSTGGLTRDEFSYLVGVHEWLQSKGIVPNHP